MKQSIFFFAAMLVLTISAHTANAQMVTIPGVGQMPANTLVIVPGYGQMTAAQAVQYYQPQQPANLPTPNMNTGGQNQMSQYNTQTAMAENALNLKSIDINNQIGKETIKDMRSNRARGWVKTVVEGSREVVGAINETRQTTGNLDVQSATAYLLRKQANCIGCGTTNPGYNPNGTINNQGQYYNGQNVNGYMWYDGKLYIVYDNRNNLGPYIILDGVHPTYLSTKNIAWNGPLDYKYAGNWAQGNNYQAPNPNYQYQQQQTVYNPYQQTGYQYPQTQQQPTYNQNGGSYGGNWDPNTNSQPAGYSLGVRNY